MAGRITDQSILMYKVQQQTESYVGREKNCLETMLLTEYDRREEEEEGDP